MTYSTTKNRGFTLVETLTYLAGLIIILGGIVIFLIYLFNWYRGATIPARADQIGLSMMTQITNDLRASNSLNDSWGIYDSQNGQISMTATQGTNSTTTVYYLQSGKLKVKIGAAATTTLSASDVVVSGFYVKKLVTANSVVVHVELDINYQSSTAATSTNAYSGLAILRQSYD